MSDQSDRLRQKAWYRTFLVCRALAYVFLTLLAIGAAQGAPAYSYTDYTTGLIDTVPARPFDWNVAFMTSGIGWLLIEGARVAIVYIAMGNNELGSQPAKRSGYSADDELEDWDTIRRK